VPATERARDEARRIARGNLSDHFNACGYALANAEHDTRAIQDWLGHRAIQHIARYAS
jgi:integrase